MKHLINNALDLQASAAMNNLEITDKEAIDIAERVQSNENLCNAIGNAFGSNSSGPTFLEFIGMQMRDMQQPMNQLAEALSNISDPMSPIKEEEK